MLRARALTAAVAGLLALSACGSSSGSGSTKDTVPAGATLINAEDGIQWSDSTYQATSTNGKITIAGENSSSLAHNLYIISADGTKNPTFIDMPKRGTTIKEFKITPGTYQVVCLIPGHDKMKATLTVG
jgi:ABC-type glycerol-3-phosphate transport system substrate-binding protein